MKVYYCFPEGKFKALTMSYDDGVRADRRLISIFNEHGIRGTFNLNYNRTVKDISEVNENGRIPASEVAQLYKGHEVATHTSHHPTIARCPLTYVAEEILEDRKGLESLVGYQVRGHAYPNGSYTKEIEQLFRFMGIAYGRVAASEPSFELPENPMEWKGTCHHKDPKLMEYARDFVHFNKKQYLRLMYVWGHSYEFDRDDNWNVIQAFCEFVGGRSDIWYATNIEIIDYMEVLKRLQFNAACDGVYNPSAQSAWLSINDNTIVEAKGGCFTAF